MRCCEEQPWRNVIAGCQVPTHSMTPAVRSKPAMNIKSIQKITWFASVAVFSGPLALTSNTKNISSHKFAHTHTRKKAVESNNKHLNLLVAEHCLNKPKVYVPCGSLWIPVAQTSRCSKTRQDRQGPKVLACLEAYATPQATPQSPSKPGCRTPQDTAGYPRIATWTKPSYARPKW